jgi:hypothetical protein
LPDYIENHFELRVVLLFEFLKLARQVFMHSQDFPQTHERPQIPMLTRTARLLRGTVESMATPCSVKAKGR